MELDRAVAIIRNLQPDLQRQGIEHVYLFGSVARNEAAAASDVDVAFDIAPSAIGRFSLLDQSRIRRQLAAALNAPVDFIERAYLRPRIADRAAADMLQVF